MQRPSGRILNQETLRQIRPADFFKGVLGEMRKVTWPSREETLRLTLVVLALSLAVGLLLGGIDQLLTVTFGKFVLRVG